MYVEKNIECSLFYIRGRICQSNTFACHVPLLKKESGIMKNTCSIQCSMEWDICARHWHLDFVMSQSKITYLRYEKERHLPNAVANQVHCNNHDTSRYRNERVAKTTDSSLVTCNTILVHTLCTQHNHISLAVFGWCGLFTT